jgi:hypothetical protein
MPEDGLWKEVQEAVQEELTQRVKEDMTRTISAGKQSPAPVEETSMTDDQIRAIREAWKDVLLLVPGETEEERWVRLKYVLDKAETEGGCDKKRPWHLIAVAVENAFRPTNTLVMCFEPSSFAHLPLPPKEILVHGIKGGTSKGPVGLPIQVFVHDDCGHTWQRELDKDGNWKLLI